MERRVVNAETISNAAFASRFFLVFRTNDVEVDVRSQRLRDDDRTVFLLIHFHHREESAADRDRGAVERVNEVRSFFALDAVTGVQAARLVVGAVRRAGNFAVTAASRHPGFEVVFAVGRAAEVAGRGVDDAIRDFKAVENVAFKLQKLLVQRFALFRKAEREHFDLRELVNAVQTARRSTGRARFGAEAVADPAKAHRKLFRVDRLVREETAEGDFRRRDEAKVAVFNRVDLRFVAARDIAGALQDVVFRQVRRRRRRETGANEFAQGVLFEREFEENRFVFEEVEPGAGDARSAFEVD